MASTSKPSSPEVQAELSALQVAQASAGQWYEAMRRRAMELGLSLSEALKAAYAVAFPGAEPMADAIRDGEFLDALEVCSTVEPVALELAFYEA